MNIKKCKCGADIAFVNMVSGKKMPVDAKPENMVFIADTPYPVDLFFVEGKGEMVKVYRPHWGTCPLAKQFKKKDKKGD
jgi:hypothetical protein